jgi:hypothetical protein
VSVYNNARTKNERSTQGAWKIFAIRKTYVMQFFVDVFLRVVVVFQTGRVVHRVRQRVQSFFAASLPVQVLPDEL